MLANKKTSRDVFYFSYIQTYIERDVRSLTKVTDLTTFQRFLKVAAARTGQLINYAEMARDADVDQKTVKSWISILETSGLIYLLQPYHSNITSRLVKTPKSYFLDTGLCAYLTGWSTSESLESGSMSGAILKTFLVSEVLKSYYNSGVHPNLFFYRDKDQKEIDLIIEYDQCLHPVEFKKTAIPTIDAAKNFHILNRLNVKVGPGVVFCFRETPIPISESVTALPISYL